MRLLTCNEVIDFLGAYVEDELPSAVRVRFDEHVAVCPACVDYIETYRQTKVLTRRAAEQEARPEEDGAPESLVAAILAAWQSRQGEPPP
jgi:anti-sigma factor RsiW